MTEECRIKTDSARNESGSTRQYPLLAGLFAFASVLVLDQVAKWIVIEELGPGAPRDVVTVIPGALRLIFVRNTGSAFGMFQGNSEILKVASLLAIVVLVVFYARAARSDWFLSLALGLQLGGAIGNIIDRFRFGYVVDWIDVPRWPTFNIADSAITIGVILLAWALIFRDARARQDHPPDQALDQRRPSRPAGEEA